MTRMLVKRTLPVRGTGVTLVVALGVGLAACSPNSGGAGSGSDAMVADDGSGSASESASTEAEGTASGSGGTAASGATAPVDDTADGPAMDEGPVGHPDVTISPGPVLDFGALALGEGVEQALTVTNEGDGDATMLQVAGVGGAFSVVSDACGPTLSPGDACEVQVAFDPVAFGDVQTELQIAYQDQGMATMAALQLVGRGVGTTPSLLVNGGGEEGDAIDIPPLGWSIGYGPSWSSGWQGDPFEGERAISAGWGPPAFDDFALEQQVDVAALTTWGDAEGVEVSFRAHHRSEVDGNDPTWVELRFLDGGGNSLAAYPSNVWSSPTWTLSEGSFVAPAGTRYAQLSLRCDRAATDWCDGVFDGMELWAAWAG